MEIQRAIDNLSCMKMEIRDAEDIKQAKRIRITTIETAITALKKQISQEVPDIEHFGRCPDCDIEFNSELLNEYNIAYCPNCGQKLKW